MFKNFINFFKYYKFLVIFTLQLTQFKFFFKFTIMVKMLKNCYFPNLFFQFFKLNAKFVQNSLN